MSDSYDLAIIGSGSAAFAAAIRAVELQARVVMIERGTIGGTCVNVGCVPSKALLRAAHLRHQAEQNSWHGAQTSAGAVDFAALIEQKNALVEAMRAEKYLDLSEEYGWEMRQGEARFADSEKLLADGHALQASHYLVASGATPVVPAIPGLHAAGYLTSTSALELEEQPRRLAVIGASAIGLELGQLFARLGSQVTLLELQDRIAPLEEPEISWELAAALREEGLGIECSAQIVKVESRQSGRRLHYSVAGEERSLDVDQILVATGRRPNTAGLALDLAEVQLDQRGAIRTNDQLQSSNSRVWAAGDVTASAQYVYLAAYQGRLAAENALTGSPQPMELAALPRITFSSPAIAAVGMGEGEARAAGYQVDTSLLPIRALARAQVNSATHGLFKLVAEQGSGRILGVHILAEHAGDTIYAGQLAVKFGLTVNDLLGTFSPYLTLGEGLRLAAQGFSQDISKLSCCAG